MSDLRHALRRLRHTPGLTLLAVIVLGVSIAINVAVFTVVNATLLKGFRGIPDQHDLVPAARPQGNADRSHRRTPR